MSAWDMLKAKLKEQERFENSLKKSMREKLDDPNTDEITKAKIEALLPEDEEIKGEK